MEILLKVKKERKITFTYNGLSTSKGRNFIWEMWQGIKRKLLCDTKRDGEEKINFRSKERFLRRGENSNFHIEKVRQGRRKNN